MDYHKDVARETGSKLITEIKLKNNEKGISEQWAISSKWPNKCVYWRQKC